MGYALAGLVAAIAIMFLGLLASVANAAPRCNTVFCAKQAAVHHQVVAATIPYPVVGYQVGQHLQQQAVDEQGFRSSPSQQRLTYLEGYYEATQRLTDSAAGSSSPPQDVPGHPAQPEEGPNTPQAFSAPLPPAAPPAEPQRYLESTGEPLMPGQHKTFPEAHPTVAASCASCHANADSNGGFGIAEAVVNAKANADADAILGIITPIAFRTMPQGKEMTDTQRIDAIAELLSK